VQIDAKIAEIEYDRNVSNTDGDLFEQNGIITYYCKRTGLFLEGIAPDVDPSATILQPDLMVICDKTKYQNGLLCIGVPDFILEVVSPSNPRHDYSRKLNKYTKAGVKEYWIVDPMKKRVLSYSLSDEADFDLRICSFDDRLCSILFPELEVNFTEVSKFLI